MPGTSYSATELKICVLHILKNLVNSACNRDVGRYEAYHRYYPARHCDALYRVLRLSHWLMTIWLP
jgi:hypothetical protein